jgi:glutamate-ammonia-ligase adenylyltransferase
MTEHAFLSDLFLDPTSSPKTLHKLSETFLASGSQYSIDEFASALEKQLCGTPDPGLALTCLLRFAEASVSKASLFNDLLHYPVLFEVLMKVFGHSQYFADILVRDPELFRWLTTSDSLTKPRTREVLVSEVHRVEEMFLKPERKLDGLKRLYRREVLRVGVRDILGEADLLSVTQELSHLADVLIDASCRIAGQQLSEKFPKSPKTRYAVIGLGKLGGSELNYSSDIDIIFVYGDEGRLKGSNGRSTTYLEYYHKFVERVVQNLSGSSAEGHLYRVDTRLRPESGAGPLARSVQSFLTHYESRGELWERQMLIKARPVAGDVEFGCEFLRQLEPFVYPRTFFHHPAESIARVKARIEAAIDGDENIKLRAGGIRDVEFVVQALQLLNGGKDRSLRETNTLLALERLRAVQLLLDDEATTMRQAYIFFRTLEHRLQTMLNTQTHTLPSDARTLSTLARRMNLSSADELLGGSEAHSKAVKKVFDAVLSVEVKEGRADLAALVDGNVNEKTMTEVLARHGFQDCRRAAKNLAILTQGSSLIGARDLDARARSLFRSLASDLFGEISATASPDITLHNLATLVAAQKLPDTFYTQLRERGFRKFILTLCGISPRFVKGLAQHPLLLETLISDAQLLAGPRLLSPLPAESIIDLKNQEELRAGVRNVLGFTSYDELTEELSQLADVIVTSVYMDVCREYRGKSVPLAIFAVGKYGTREITFDADLDIIFIAEPRSTMSLDKMEKIATAIVGRLSAVSEKGRLYDIDARLRPEGKNAPLVADRGAYNRYLSERASLWERQSLTRVRFVCGDESLGKEVMRNIESYVFDSPLPPSWVQTIVAMRRKMESRSRTSHADHLDVKLGAGGMVDIEFIAQMFQLRSGRDQTGLRSKPTRAVLEASSTRLRKGEEQVLTSSYYLFREIEKLIRISLEEPGSFLPIGPKLALLSRLLGHASADSFRGEVASMMKQVRRMFLEITERISDT